MSFLSALNPGRPVLNPGNPLDYPDDRDRKSAPVQMAEVAPQAAAPHGMAAPVVQHPMHALIAPIMGRPVMAPQDTGEIDSGIKGMSAPQLPRRIAMMAESAPDTSPKPEMMSPTEAEGVRGLHPADTPQFSAPPAVRTMSPIERREEQLQEGLDKKPEGFWPKFGHYAGMAGRIAGDIIAPDHTEFIVNQLGKEGVGPGANLARNEEMRNLEKEQSETGLQGAQTANTEANTEYTKQKPAIEQTRIQQKNNLASDKNAAQLAKSGYKLDENGDITPMSYEEMSPAQQSTYDLKNSQQQLADSTETLREAQAEVERAKNDPNSPAYKIAVSRLGVAQQNANAAGIRAQAYMGRYLQSAFNTDLHGNYLPGAPQIENEAGNVTTVGTGNANQASKAQSSAAQFNDVHGALDSIEGTAQKLTRSGGKLNSPQIIAALQAPHSTISQWIHSVNKANLSPEERDYVMSNIALHENIQGMRKSAGGAATDSQVENLLRMAPGGTTPDLDYLTRQTEQIRQTAERLGKGVTTARGGLNVRGQNANKPGIGAGSGPKVGDKKNGFTFDGKGWTK